MHKCRIDISWAESALEKKNKSEGSDRSQAEQGLLSCAKRRHYADILTEELPTRHLAGPLAVLSNASVQRHIQSQVLLLKKG